MSALFEVRGLTVRHGGLVALDGVDLSVERGSIVGLIGPNGAGKSTFIDAVSGFVTPSGGTVAVDGRDLTTMSPAKRVRAGLCRTFQAVELFDDLTAEEHLLVAAPAPSWRSTITDVFWPKSSRPTAVEETLRLLGISDLRAARPAALSTAERQRLALGRAVVSSPHVVLVDEPAAGLDGTETAAMADLLRSIAAAGIAVLVVDHDMSLIMSVCDRVDVLDLGRRVASGTPEAVRRDPAVIDAYLGARR